MKNFFDKLVNWFHPSKFVFKPDVKEVEISGQKIYIRSLSAGYAISLKGKNLGDSEIFDVLSRSICDKDGNPVLTQAQAEELGLTTVSQLVKEVMLFNSITAGAVALATEELKKTEDSTIN